MVNDKVQDIFCIIDRVTEDALDQDIEFFPDLGKERYEKFWFLDISWSGGLCKRKLWKGIRDNMVSVAPKESNLFLKRFGKVDNYAQPTIWVSFGGLGLIKSILNRGLKVIFFNLSQKGTGVDR